MRTNKGTNIYTSSGVSENIKKQLLESFNALEHKLERKTPQFGGCYYDRDFNKVYIKEVIYNDPAVVVYWSDGTKTTAKRDPLDTWDSEKGLLLCVVKKLVNSDFAIRTLKDWGEPELGKKHKTLSDVRKVYRKSR